MKTTVPPGIEDADVRIEEEVITIDEETESLIREYQRSTIPEPYNLRLMEFYGGEYWRKDEGAEMKRCIQRIVEKELIDKYHKNLKPSEEVGCVLEERIGENWREEQGVPGRNYIMMLSKEERNTRKEKMKK